MSVIRNLLGLNFFRREPWCFPETKVSSKGGVVVGNSRILRRENISLNGSQFVIEKEIVPGFALNRTGQSQGQGEQGEKIPLHVKLRGEQSGTKTILTRKRKMTRLSSAGSSSSKLNNVFSLKGSINSEEALSIGYAALELGIKYLRIIAPSGREAVERLRVVRTIASRFNLGLIISVSSVEELDFCLSWSDLIELEVSRENTQRELLRKVVSSEKSLALRRSNKMALDDFVRVTSNLQLESSKEFIILESGAEYSAQFGTLTFNVGMIQRLTEKTGAEVILDLTQADREAPLNVQLAGVASGANGLVLQFDHKQSTSSFENIQVVTQKLEAMKYTLDAIAQIK